MNSKIGYNAYSSRCTDYRGFKPCVFSQREKLAHQKAMDSHPKRSEYAVQIVSENDDFGDDADEKDAATAEVKGKIRLQLTFEKKHCCSLVMCLFIIISFIFGLLSYRKLLQAIETDSLTHGTWEFEESSVYNDLVETVIFECTDTQLEFTYYYTDGYISHEYFLYNSTLCDEDEDVFNSDWCHTMYKLGQVKTHNIFNIF